jgi:hypothetical protein
VNTSEFSQARIARGIGGPTEPLPSPLEITSMKKTTDEEKWLIDDLLSEAR